jgi:hypothetical protein
MNRAGASRGLVAQVPSPTTIETWFGADFAKGTPEQTALYPHKTDYCAICQSLQLDIDSCKASESRHKQQADGRAITGAEGFQEVVAQREQLENELKEHRQDAAEAMADYKTRAAQARPGYLALADRFASYLEACADLEPDEEPDGYDALLDEIANFGFAFSSDYQQDKAVPYWGYSPQPGPTYFMSHLTFYVHIICAESLGHADGPSLFGRNRVYTRAQTVGGSKDGNDTLSTIFDFLLDNKSTGVQVPRLRTGWSEDGAYDGAH